MFNCFLWHTFWYLTKSWTCLFHLLDAKIWKQMFILHRWLILCRKKGSVLRQNTPKKSGHITPSPFNIAILRDKCKTYNFFESNHGGFKCPLSMDCVVYWATFFNLCSIIIVFVLKLYYQTKCHNQKFERDARESFTNTWRKALQSHISHWGTNNPLFIPKLPWLKVS